MDELHLVRERAEAVGFATAADLAPARARLLAAARAESRRRSRRWLWTASATTAGLATITAVVALTPAGPDAGARADPVLVLAAAASAAAGEPAAAPRPGQFLYVKTEFAGHRTREVWLSVDGTRDGRAGDAPVPGCRDGHAPLLASDDPALIGTPAPCRAAPAYRTDLPATADAMLAYLRARNGGKGADALGEDVLSLSSEQALPPASAAALYEAAAKIPGLQALDHVTDGAGRPGVGITWPNPAGSHHAKPYVLVFDAATHRFLGTDDSAVTVKTFVDQVGQRP